MCESPCDNMGSFQTILDGKSPAPMIQSSQIKWGERPQVCGCVVTLGPPGNVGVSAGRLRASLQADPGGHIGITVSGQALRGQDKRYGIGTSIMLVSTCEEVALGVFEEGA